MNRMRIAASAVLMGTLGGLSLSGQQATASKTLGATMEVYVFPEKGQSASQQSQDESACYNWAVQNTGADPFQLMKQAQVQQQQAASAQASASTVGQGSGVRGAAGGAAAGALFGAIGGNAGKGAAIGAASGAVFGRVRGSQAQASAQQQVAQQSAANQQATAQQIDNFKKAFSVCLEAKHYLVKY